MTTQVCPFSKPNPELLTSLSSVKQTGRPLLKPAEGPDTGGGAAPAGRDDADEELLDEEPLLLLA